VWRCYAQVTEWWYCLACASLVSFFLGIARLLARQIFFVPSGFVGLCRVAIARVDTVFVLFRAGLDVYVYLLECLARRCFDVDASAVGLTGSSKELTASPRNLMSTSKQSHGLF
jgi:hypothetical protein